LVLEIKKKYLNIQRGSHISLSWFSSRSSILVELEFGDVGFVEGGKPENPEKYPQGENQPEKIEPIYDPNRARFTLMKNEHSCEHSAPFLLPKSSVADHRPVSPYLRSKSRVCSFPKDIWHRNFQNVFVNGNNQGPVIVKFLILNRSRRHTFT